MDVRWPGLPYEQRADTRDTLHLWTQVIRKVKLAVTPFLNDWWNLALTLTCRGLITGPMPAGRLIARSTSTSSASSSSSPCPAAASSST